MALNDSDKILGESHANVSADAGEDVPPAVQLKEKAPWKSDVVLDFCDIAAQVEVDAPEEVAEQEVCCLWSAKS